MYERKNLILDYSTNPFTFDLELTNDVNDLDFDLKGSLSDIGIIKSDIVFYYDFNYQTNINSTSSLYSYNLAKPSGSTLSLMSTGSSISFGTDININKQFVNFNGGYYSGIYLSGSTYQVLPSPSPKGYSLNFWINSETNSEEGYLFKIGDENNGYGFYYKEGRLGWITYVERLEESGNTRTLIQTGVTDLIFTGTTGNSWTNVTIVFKRNEELIKCCEECDDNEFNLHYDLFEDCITLDNIPDTNKGTLSFYINGRPIYKKEIEEPVIKIHNVSIGESYRGAISIASMYSKSLTIPEIIINYYGLKDIYKRPENFGGINIKVNSNLTK